MSSFLESCFQEHYPFYSKLTADEQQTLVLSSVLTQHKYLGLPSFESVSRTRRKLQARYPELAGSRPVQKMRATGEKAYRRYAKE